MGHIRPIAIRGGCDKPSQHMQQQTGVPPIIMQQVHPPFMQAIMP